MTKTLRVLLAIFGCVACSITTFAGGPFGIIDVGRWQGAAYTNDKGAFSYCIAAAKFPNSGLVLFQNADHSWLIGFVNSDWNLSERSLPIILTFDGQAQIEVVASAREKTVVAPLWKEALAALRKARLLVATGSKRTIQFDLSGAGNVVPTIENCVNTMNAKGIAAAGDFSKSSVPNSKPPTAQ